MLKEAHVQFEGDQHQRNQHIEYLPHFVGEQWQTAFGVDLRQRQVRYATVVRARYVILEAGGTCVLATSVRCQSCLTAQVINTIFFILIEPYISSNTSPARRLTLRCFRRHPGRLHPILVTVHATTFLVIL